MAAPLRPGQLTLISLAATAAVLLVVIAWETGWGEGLHARLPTRSLPAAAPVGPKLLPQLVASAPEQAWPETATRPIFVPGRRPAPALNAPNAMRKGQFILQGTTIVGPLSIAMLKETSTGRLYRLEKGRDLQGMTLAEVAPDRVTLRAGEDSETLLLMVTKAAAAAPGAPAPFVQSGPFTPSAPAAAPPPLTAAMPAAASGPQGPVGASGVPQASTITRPVAAGAAAAGLPPGMPTGAPPAASTDSSAMTPEEILARRRAARRSQQTN
jgi:hypothetical protein